MMMNDIFIGVDVGTTVLKAAAFDGATGRCLAGASEALTIRVAPGGKRDMDVRALDRAFGSVFAALGRALGRRARRVAGIGVCAQGGSGHLADRRTGRPLTPLYLWNDTRAQGLAEAVARRRSVAFWRARTFRDAPGHGLSRLLWFRRERPELFRRDAIYAGAGEHVYHLLTGAWRQDACHALQTGCYNVPRRGRDADLTAVVGFPLRIVAPMREGHATHPLSAGAARRLGLPAGIPVAGPYMDHEAGYLSALGVSRRPLQCSLGTAWVGNFELSRAARWSSPVQLVIPALTHDGWLVIQPLLTGNVTWDWALAKFVHPEKREALGRLPGIFRKRLLPPPGLVALPWFNRPNHHRFGALGAGAFLGMNAGTEPHDLVRAIAAGMVYEFARVFDDVRRRRAADAVVLGGGASRGGFFRTMLAALFRPLPVFAVTEADLGGPRGAVYPFSRRVARAPARRVAPPRGAALEGILAGYSHYRDVFPLVYGDVKVGGPLHIK
ncbi:MAG: FGGY family carbohydrate kinase [Planctomycetota bacterium]